MSASGKIHPVILSGGAGSRLWPMSRRALPKHLLDLAGPQTLLQQALMRVRGARFSAPVIISNSEQRFLVAEQVREAGLKNATLILEPAGRSTAPAVTVAALHLTGHDPDAMMLVMPSDHVICDVPAFGTAVDVAHRAALKGALATFGIPASTPETGYGYIRSGAALAGCEGALQAVRFVEKPDRPRAEEYVASGDYLWNSGMFLFSARRVLDEMERLEPAILEACRQALASAEGDLDFIRLDEAAFLSCPAKSLDYAVMEHARDVAVVPVSMGWSDVGSWHSLWDISTRDASQNAVSGDVVTEKVSGSYIRTDGPMVAAVGVKDLVIVATRDAVLVVQRQSSQDVKKIVDLLEQQKRTEHIAHPVVSRPWGTYESVDAGTGFQVKRIFVKPGKRLSLQMHHHRSEHWVVVSGTALVTCDDRQMTLYKGETTFIPLGARHRLENLGPEPLHIVEVQLGKYLGEDDIVRFEDDYGRKSDT